jgi:CHAT domain-containing protein
MDQEPVSWPELKATIERAFAARIPDRFELEAIEGTSRRSLVEAIQRRPCDVLHFSGHGRVVGGTGQLILTDRRTQRSSPITADELAIALRGKGIRLVVLSACETAAGDFADDFSVVAPTLVKAGISAVVANQLPVPDSTVATFVGALYASLLESGE